MSDMGMGRDELRRQMRDAQVEHLETMGGFREAIKRFAGGDPAFNRRGLLVAGGGVMAAMLAACADHTPKPQVPEGGAQTPTTVTIAPPPVNDVTLLRTASSIEILAVQTYQKGIDSGLLTTPALLDAAKLFRDQHHDHNDLFTAATTEAGGEPYTEPNPYIQLKAVDTILPSVKKEVDLVNLALELEDTAGGSYQVWVPLFSTPELRQTLQSVGATERRHSIILTGVLPEEELFPSPFGNVTLAVGPASYV
jgi:Ferritin-like domain